MITFKLKTYNPSVHYEQPHFFIQCKGTNSGKPLLKPCPNCFVCATSTDKDKEFMYWLCFGLWRSRSFHFYLKGSVIPFITINEMRTFLYSSSCQAFAKEEAFKKSIRTLKTLEDSERSVKSQLQLIETARQLIFRKLFKEVHQNACS